MSGRYANDQAPAIRWERPPAWLERVPDTFLQLRGRAGTMHPEQHQALCRWLDGRGLPRPTLMAWEAERKRRGFR